MALEFRGKHLEFLNDTMPELDLEGARSCGKTILCLWKELEAVKRHPGMWVYIGRYSDDATKLLLRPELERVAAIHGTDLSDWDRDENCYKLPNGSRIYSFGLKTVSPDPDVRYKKIRGLSVSRIYVDQAEELPGDIASELRFPLRPDITASHKGLVFPRQLTFSPNPAHTESWLAKQFPADNRFKNRRYYRLTLYDNKHNLPPEMIESLEQEYPIEHPRHQTLIMGERGLNVIGDPVYENMYDRKIHVRDLQPIADGTLLEAFEFGRHNPVWICGQRTYHGSLQLLGGVIGKRLVLEDFLPIVKQFRAEWFESETRKPVWKTCVTPMGETVGRDRYTLVNMLRESGFRPVWRENTNAHDVQLAMIEQVAGLLRRRTVMREEAIALNADKSKWMSASQDGTLKQVPFLSYAFEGGFVWDQNPVSVSNKEMRQPFEDDEYASAMRCVHNLILNFCAGQTSDYDREQQRQEALSKQAPTSPAPGGPGSWMAH